MINETFSLGTFSAAGCAPFPAVVRDNRALALHAINRWREQTGAYLTGVHDLVGFIDNWVPNIAALECFLDNEPGASRAAWADVSDLKVHAPLVSARQILCVGANYRQHVLDHAADFGGGNNDSGTTAEERREEAQRKIDERAANGLPYAFSKLPSAMVGPYDNICLPADVVKPDWELELAVVMARPARHVRREEAMALIAGYMVANDLTARDRLYRPDMRTIASDWLSSKSVPTFMPSGPYLVPAAFVGDPHTLHLTLELNGIVMQDASASDMIFDIARQIEYLSNRIQLYPGDIILTGSPAGNGTHHGRFLQPGDEIVGRIESIGELRNRVVAEVPLS